MRTTRPMLLAVMLALSLAFVSGSALGGGGSIAALFGERMMDFDLQPGDEALEPLEDQDQLGLMFTYGGSGWPVSLAIDILRSDDDIAESYSVSYYGPVYTVNLAYDVEVQEIDLGVRKEFGGGKVRGYVGGGLALVDVEADVSASITGGPIPFSFSDSESDDATGYWASGGVLIRIGRLIFGIDGRFSDAEVTIGTDDIDAGATQISGFVGFRWGD